MLTVFAYDSALLNVSWQSWKQNRHVKPAFGNFKTHLQSAVSAPSINSDRIIMAALCFGLIYAAVVRIVSALRPTQIIYIQ